MKVQVRQVARLTPGDFVNNKGKIEMVLHIETSKEDSRITLITTKSGTFEALSRSYIVP